MFEINSLKETTSRLTIFIEYGLSRPLETIRIARAAYALLLSGCNDFPKIIPKVIESIVLKQQLDGGWSDPEEAAWAVGCLRAVEGQGNPSVLSAMKWLNSLRNPDGGWGMHPRDQARIRTTALISALVPEMLTDKDLVWLTNEWHKDFSGPVRLSYKAGFFLLSTPPGINGEIVNKTIIHLEEDQNDDGGFAPWKDHPIGSDPWSTGVVLWGLSRWGKQVDPTVLERALGWLERTRLPSGYWPYHFLDDGTSLALIGAVSALKALSLSE